MPEFSKVYFCLHCLLYNTLFLKRKFDLTFQKLSIKKNNNNNNKYFNNFIYIINMFGDNNASI